MISSRKTITYSFICLLALFMIVPLVWLVITSFKKESEYLAYPITILPSAWQWINYYLATTMAPFFRNLGNTVYLASTFTILCTLSSALVGFGFARHNAPGKNALFTLVLAMIILPFMVTLVPQFIIFSRLHLTGSYWPWILWGLTASPWHIFLFRQFFSTFPKELEDAAEVDGCNRLRIFWQIFLPNAWPALIISAIFNFQWVWGDFINPLIFLSSENTTLAVKLSGSTYVDPHQSRLITITMAAVVLYILPVAIGFFAAQKRIIEGIVTTGIKG
ncbi:MAG: carbohydrate ABC transporter permease [Anaerolineaceae bacterium]|nr:carbohydrate ABC transporter permease [Anaerolineaceae bacterium]